MADTPDLAPTTLRLTVTTPGTLCDRTYAIAATDGDVLVGRSDRADVRIDEPSVGWCHLRLRWHGSDLVVRDLSSRWGTRVNGHRFVGARYLHDGDALCVGDVALRADLTSATA